MKKYAPFLCVTAVALIAWLFLPFMDLGFETLNIVDILGEADISADLAFISIIVAILGGLVGIVSALMQKKGGATVGSVLGLAGVLVCIITFMDDMGMEIGDLFEYLGMGVWLALVGYIVALVLALKIKKTNEA